MRVKITNGNGWYKDCVGLSFAVEEKVSERFGVLLVVSEDAPDFGSKISRFIERADCEILPDEDSTEPEALRARLTATEGALTAARELIETTMSKSLVNGNDEIECYFCDGTWGDHVEGCGYLSALEAFTATVARLQEMTE